jgi:hypothetical protein
MSMAMPVSHSGPPPNRAGEPSRPPLPLALPPVSRVASRAQTTPPAPFSGQGNRQGIMPQMFNNLTN